MAEKAFGSFAWNPSAQFHKKEYGFFPDCEIVVRDLESNAGGP
jgi:hypothetical protein